MNIRSAGVFGDKNSGSGLYEGVPSEVIARRTWAVYDQDFIELGGGATIYAQTQIAGVGGAFTIVISAANGIARASATTINEGIQAQFGGSSSSLNWAVPVAGRTIVYEVTMTAADWNDMDWFAGFAATDTTFMDVDGALLTVGGDNCIGFHSLLGETSPRMVYATTAGGGVATLVRTATGLIYDTSIVNATYYTFGIRLYGTTTAEFYFGTRSTGTTEPGGIAWSTRQLARVTTPAFAAAMNPSFAVVANGSAITLDIDRILVAQTR